MIHGSISPGVQAAWDLGAAECPPPIPSGGSGGFVTPLRPKYRRYQDQGLHEAYTHVVSALRKAEVPVYGKVFSENEADAIARQAVDAVRKLPQSTELQNRLRCVIEPMVAGAARSAVSRLLLGAVVVGMAGVAGGAGWRLARRGRS